MAKPIPDELRLSPEQWSLIEALGTDAGSSVYDQRGILVAMNPHPPERWIACVIEPDDLEHLRDLISRGLVEHHSSQGELALKDDVGLPPVVRLSKAGWEQWVLLGRSP